MIKHLFAHFTRKSKRSYLNIEDVGHRYKTLI